MCTLYFAPIWTNHILVFLKRNTRVWRRMMIQNGGIYANVAIQLGCIASLECICDRSEQKQPFGWVLTNPLHVTPLRPDSTVIDGFSKLIPQRIAVEISYLLVYCSWKSINNCGAGTQWRNVWWIRQGTPKRLLLLGAVTFIDGFSKVVAQKIANR